VQELERLAARVHHELTHGDEVLRLGYLPAFDPLQPPNGRSNGQGEAARQLGLLLDAPVDRSSCTPEMIRRGFREALLRLRAEEVARGMTTIGPHRDELRFQANGIDLGIYGSRGQVRTAMLALKLAETRWMKEKTGDWPVLLLDEVLAELDTGRRRDLLDRLSQSEQVLLTTTDLDLFMPEFVQRARVWRVQNGRVEPD
jgi:DNA replication and repair protein RecF